jgi:hypothetical protein
MQAEIRRIPILCKTYPSPSVKHTETSCVAGVDETGKLIRLFPVPFRLITDEQQFRKWQWIKARVRKASEDHRVESHRVSVDTIETQGEPLPTTHGWTARKEALQEVEVFQDFGALEQARQERGVTLGLLRPSRLKELHITPCASTEWTADEVAKLMQAQNQGNLFDADSLAEQKSLKLLKKLPFDFHYDYECEINGETRSYKHKVVDWEAGALYWNVHRRSDWQAAFRQKWLTEFSERDVVFLMGTIHRFPGQWLIVSVLYLPKPLPEETNQGKLF